MFFSCFLSGPWCVFTLWRRWGRPSLPHPHTPVFSRGDNLPLPFILPSHSGPLLPTVNPLSSLLAHLLGNLASTLIPSLSGTFRHSLPATSSSGVSLQVLPSPPLVSAALKDAYPFLPIPLVTSGSNLAFPQPAPVVFQVHSA